MQQQCDKEAQHRQVEQTTLSELQQLLQAVARERNELKEQAVALEDRCDVLRRSVALESLTSYDAAMWIVNLDEARYGKYHDDLVRNMVADGVDGQFLVRLERNDLKGLGITSIRDRSRCDIFDVLRKQIEHNALQQKYDQLIDDLASSKECMVCRDGERTWAFVPCGHLCVCSECKDKPYGEACLLCGAQSDHMMRIYV